MRSSPCGPNGKPSTDLCSDSVVDGNGPSPGTRSPALGELSEDLVGAPESPGTEELEAVQTSVRGRLAAEAVPVSELVRSADGGEGVDLEDRGR